MSEEETRQRILGAAVQLFSERGYDGATTRAIAALASFRGLTESMTGLSFEAATVSSIRRKSSCEPIVEPIIVN